MKNVRNPLIFVVEENPVYKDLITGYLSEKKIKNLKTFKDGGECLNSIHFKPDVIVLDYSIEGINGLDLMHKIRKEQPGVDFIFLSAQNNVELAVHIMKQGAYDYIVKTDRAPEKLVKSINSAIAQTKKIKMKRGFRVGLIGFFSLLLVIILIVVALRYFFNW